MADAEAFDELYRSARDRLVMQVAALTGDSAEALDHVQEGFVRAWARWDQVSGYEDPEGWVRRVAYNHAVSRWRRARKLVFHGRPLEGRVVLDAEQGDVIDALRILPPREREAIVLHYLVGLSIAQIAAELSAPTGTVKSWLSRGRVRLGKQLRSEEQTIHDTR